jgi:hypothetical protein
MDNSSIMSMASGSIHEPEHRLMCAILPPPRLNNVVVVLPDADMDMTTRIVADSSFGCAGQRCLATSVAITVGEAQASFTDRIVHAAHVRKVGNGLEPDVEMGPVITTESKQRIESLIALGERTGAKILVDGRNPSIPRYEHGNFVRPTILNNVDPRNELAHTEIFGPVLSLVAAPTIDDPSRPSTPPLTATCPASLPVAVPLPESSTTKPRQAISALTSAWRLLWLSSHSPAGKIVSSATCTLRDAMQLSFIRRKR